MGHHSDHYDEQLADEICRRIAAGQTLRSICRDDHMPNFQRVYEWLEAHEDFAGRFARARKIGFDMIGEETLEIANTPVLGAKTKDGPLGTEITRGDMIEHRKLQIDTRLKLLAKWDPKRYGDKQEITHVVEDASIDRLNAARSRNGKS